jgi:hypothetical protein
VFGGSVSTPDHEATKIRQVKRLVGMRSAFGGSAKTRRTRRGRPCGVAAALPEEAAGAQGASTDLRPSKRTVERTDVEAVVAEFRRFLLDGLAAGEDELPVVELE